MAEPKVRFKRDDGSSYPAWKKQTVGDMTVELTDYKPLGCGLPLLTSARTGLMFQDEYRGKTSTDNEDTLFSVVPRGAVTYRHMSDDDIFHFNINDLVDAGLVSKEYPVFNTVNGNNIRLLVEYLNSSNRFLEFCKAQKKGGTRTRLYFKVLKDFDMMFPCAEEQQKIADFLSSVDEVISASEAEVQNLETQKKAVMKKFFSQEVRFKMDDGTDFPEWKQISVKEIGEFHGGLSGKTKDDFGHGDGYFITYMNVYKNAFASVEMMDRVEVGDNERQFAIHRGDIMFTQSSETVEEVGLSSVWLHDKTPYMNSFCMVLRPYDLKTILPEFAGYLFRSTEVRKQIMLQGQGVTRVNLAPSRLESVRFKYPVSHQEQRLIADFLSDFDEAIAAAKKELELWKELKRGLLQQMFV